MSNLDPESYKLTMQKWLAVYPEAHQDVARRYLVSLLECLDAFADGNMGCPAIAESEWQVWVDAERAYADLGYRALDLDEFNRAVCRNVMPPGLGKKGGFPLRELHEKYPDWVAGKTE